MKTSNGLLVSPAAIGLLLLASIVFVPLLAAGGAGPAATGSLIHIPQRALQAYKATEQWCSGLRWELVAAIGEAESDHGTNGGASIGDDGVVVPLIFGPPLDGTGGTRRLPIGGWLGWWGLAGPWEQAIGPMQFLAGTFAAWAVDGDDDGVTNPHDIDDAAPTAANYLCGGGTMTDERAALLRYNNSNDYAGDVIALADRLAEGSFAVGTGWQCPVAGPVTFADTWGAPRPGGRVHKGVDLFARHGTPVVAPVDGAVEYRSNSVGGPSFHLWGEDRTYYYGTHLAAYGGTVGDVRAGTVLGYVGATGNAAGTPPHLHFEIHPRRRRGDPPGPVNPTSAVATACEHHRVGIALRAAID